MENTTPLDIIIWKTAEEGHKDDSSAKNFEFYFQNQKVGKCSIRLCQNAYGIYGNNQFFPETWFCDEKHFFEFFGKSANLKPFLEITKYDFSEFQGKGFGRMGLEMIFHLSKRLGTEGRISLDAQRQENSLREPATFYEHCGFKGNDGSSGRKYFEPTPENMQALFSKPIHPLFKMKEVPIKKNSMSLIDPRTGKFRIPKKLKSILENQKN